MPRGPGRRGRHRSGRRYRRKVESPLLPALLLLLEERSSHGYELIERMKSFGVATRDPSVIYRNLNQLEEWGLVSSSWDTTAAGPGPPRRVYSISEEGRRTLHSWAEDIRQQKGHMERFLEAYRGVYSPGRRGQQ